MESYPAHVFEREGDELQAGVGRFFNQDAYSDLVMVAPDGRRIKCHRVLLAACSPLLAATLPACGRAGDELPVTGVDSDALEAVVRFFYKGRLHLTLRGAVAILDAAQRLQVASVARAAREYARRALSSRTAVPLLVEALRYEVPGLADEAAACAALCFNEVTATAEFLCAPFSAALSVLRAAKTAAACPARDVFAAAWRWLTADMAHVKHLEEVLVHVTSPDLSIQDLLSVSGLAVPGGAAAGSTAAAVAPALQQLLGAARAAVAEAPEGAETTGGTAVADTAAAQVKEEEAAVPAPAAEAPAAAVAAAAATLEASPEPSPFAAVAPEAAPIAVPLPLTLPPHASQLLATLLSGGAGAPAATAAESVPLAATPEQLAALLAAASGAGLPGISITPLLPVPSGATDSEAGFKAEGSGGALERMRARPASRTSGALSSGPRTPAAKGVCQVDGCFCDLSTLRDYHQRYKICEYHLKVPSVMRDDRPQRFCQQCGRFHPLEEFDGTKRSCRSRLQKHNARRRKRDPTAADLSGGEEAGGSGGASRGKRRVNGEESDDGDYGRGAVSGRTGGMGSVGGGGGGSASALDMLAAVANEGDADEAQHSNDAAPPAPEAAAQQTDPLAAAAAAAAAAMSGGDAGQPAALHAMLCTLLTQPGLPPAVAAAAAAAAAGLAPSAAGLPTPADPEAATAAPGLPLLPPVAVKGGEAGGGAAAVAAGGAQPGSSSSDTKHPIAGERSPTSSGISGKVML